MTQLLKLKLFLILVLVSSIFLSCNSSHDETEQKSNGINSSSSYPYIDADTLPELTTEQQSAFDALNSIQVQGQHLYSTFPGIHHDCFPPDTSFVISQAELLIAMKTLLERHYTNIEAEERTTLANESILAQKEYLVLQCYGNSNRIMNDEYKNIPNSGSWILPVILGRRDLIIEW